MRDLDQLLRAREEITTLQAYFLPSFSRCGTQGDLQQYCIGFSYHHLEDNVILWGESIVRNPHISRVHGECIEERANEEIDLKRIRE